MPNPLMRLGLGQRISTDPQEHQEPETPILEHVVGNNFPYRGSQDHGVVPTEKPLEAASYAGDNAAYFEPEEPDPELIAVKVVNEAKREIRTFTTQQVIVDGNVQRILGRDPNRVSVRLTVIGAVAVWFGGDANVSKYSGYPFAQGASLDLTANDEIYAFSDTGAQQTVYMAIVSSQKL